MSALTHFDALTTHVTRVSANSGDELSSILLVLSAVTLGAAGIGVIILCARALLRGNASPMLPVGPWIEGTLASPAIGTRNYAEAVAKAAPAAVAMASESESDIEAPPISEASAVTLRNPGTDLPPPAPVTEAPTSSPLSGPSSTEPTLEMDMGAFPQPPTPPDEDTAPSSDPADSAAFLASPIPLISKKALPAPQAPEAADEEEPSEPPRAHRSGSMPKAGTGYVVRAPDSFGDGARRA
jgi:hypothetical protein